MRRVEQSKNCTEAGRILVKEKTKNTSSSRFPSGFCSKCLNSFLVVYSFPLFNRWPGRLFKSCLLTFILGPLDVGGLGLVVVRFDSSS